MTCLSNVCTSAYNSIASHTEDAAPSCLTHFLLTLSVHSPYTARKQPASRNTRTARQPLTQSGPNLVLEGI